MIGDCQTGMAVDTWLLVQQTRLRAGFILIRDSKLCVYICLGQF